MKLLGPRKAAEPPSPSAWPLYFLSCLSLNSFTPSASRVPFIQACLPESRQLIAHFRQMFLFNKKKKKKRKPSGGGGGGGCGPKPELISKKERIECVFCSEPRANQLVTMVLTIPYIKMQNSDRIESSRDGNTMEIKRRARRHETCNSSRE